MHCFSLLACSMNKRQWSIDEINLMHIIHSRILRFVLPKCIKIPPFPVPLSVSFCSQHPPLKIYSSIPCWKQSLTCFPVHHWDSYPNLRKSFILNKVGKFDLHAGKTMILYANNLKTNIFITIISNLYNIHNNIGIYLFSNFHGRLL